VVLASLEARALLGFYVNLIRVGGASQRAMAIHIVLVSNVSQFSFQKKCKNQ
jgi:hypothetical protein